MYAIVGVLGFSRFLYLEYVASTRAEVLVACHRRMFGAFGGVPREILYDNMKTVVTYRDAYGRGRHRFHDGIWALAGECGYRPRLCRPARPQTKGKVERSSDYVAQSFFHPFVSRPRGSPGSRRRCGSQQRRRRRSTRREGCVQRRLVGRSPKMRENALDERRLLDAGNDGKPPAAPLATLDVDGQHPLEPLHPAHRDVLRRRWLGSFSAAPTLPPARQRKRRAQRRVRW